jgi:putative ABC transport system permease protein
MNTKMSLIKLVWSYLFARPLTTILNIILLSLGVGVITILIILNNQLEEKITENVKGIDLVVGAKGSPMQLILCNIFQVDFPTGNIKLVDAERIRKNRLVKKAIPLALGDSYRNFRVIGTDTAYANLYNAKLADGKWFSETMDVVIGSTVAAETKLKIADHFESNHGLTSDGHAHDEMAFVVKGVLQRSGSVVDNLILTRIESVWKVHGGHNDVIHTDDSTAERSSLVPTVLLSDSTKEITSMLIKYRSPMGAIQLPRLVNSQSALQAASPAFETTRLFSILGVGYDVIRGFAYLLVFISALSIFIALYNALKERRYDLSIMRTMGATRAKLFATIILEGLVLTFLGAILGATLGHVVVSSLASSLDEAAKAGIRGFVFYPEEGTILIGSLLLGIMCSLVPAIQVYRTDISKVLAGN